MKNINLKILLSVVCVCGFLTIASLASAESDRPNIVVIFCDDLGYGDLSSYGHPTIKTPHLDRMGEEGMRFTQFYTAAAVCSPSRGSLLTGRYPPRHGTLGVYFHHQSTGFRESEITLADVLATRDYTSACIGKWHLGHDPQFLPTNRGFDHYYGVPYSNDMGIDPETPIAENAHFREGWTRAKIQALDFETNKPKRNMVPLMRDLEIVEFPTDQSLLTRRYTDEALQFIDQNQDAPFFLYVAYTMPHIPLFASKEFLGKSRRGLYGDTVEEIDGSVGEILARLRERGLADNTLVVFTSDNGPWLTFKQNGGSPGLLRGGKFTTWEGGQRIPAIAWWPGKIEPIVTAELASTLDLFTTAIRLAGAEVPEDRTIDGLDLRGLLFHGESSPREEFAYFRQNNLQAYRDGPWKIHFRTQPEQGGKPGERLQTPLLYQIEHDPSEQYDLAEAHPEILKQMAIRARQIGVGDALPPLPR